MVVADVKPAETNVRLVVNNKGNVGGADDNRNVANVGGANINRNVEVVGLVVNVNRY